MDKPRMMIVMVGPSKMPSHVGIMLALAPDAKAICGMCHMPQAKGRQWLADWVAAGKPLITTEAPAGVLGSSTENPFYFLPEAAPEYHEESDGQRYALPLVHENTPAAIRMALNPPSPEGSNVIAFPAHPTVN